MWVYFDASVLIKRYSMEVGTSLVNELFRRFSIGHMACSTLGILEVVSVLVRKRNDGRISKTLFEQAMLEFRAEVIDNEEFSFTSVNDALLFSALELIVHHNLNSTDAVILRSVLNLREFLRRKGEDLVFLTSDKRLARAAQSEGLTVFNPEEGTIEQLYGLLGIPR